MRPTNLRLAVLLVLSLAACGDGGGPGGTGPDTEPPSVALTGPTAASGLSDVVIITADASDNSGIVKVQFHLDGVKLGTEDLEPPYLAAWETRNVANGPHTLTAVARDASGNITTSDPLAITVANPLPGNLEVTVITTGPVSDPDGYDLRLDDTQRRRIAANTTVTFANLPAGPHTVDFDGVWPFCSLQGEHPRQLDVPPGETLAVTFDVVCVAGPEGRIAYSISYDGWYPSESGIVAPRDGSAATLTKDGYGASWSPDGTQLVFIRDDDSSMRQFLYRIQADGTGETYLATLPMGTADLDWGPGSTIAFAAQREPVGGGLVRDIYVIASDGSDLRPLFVDAANRDGPALSPDGMRVAFSLQATTGAVASLWVADIDGGNRHELTTGFMDRGAAWSPDGSQIAFSRDFDWIQGLMVVAPDGTGLSNTGLLGAQSTWSPDGEWIASVDADGQLSVSRTDGMFTAQIGSGALPDWGP